ncbi:hypoxanthine phosphoribosyltransferase [Acidaminobacterium chupaoyuni]
MEKKNMYDDILKVLITKEEIEAKVAELGEAVSADYVGKDPLVISVLKGAFVFMADFVRHLSVPCTMDFMSVSSYGAGVRSSGEVKIIKDLDTIIENRHVIVVEDILDSGVTLSYLLELLRARKPASIKLVTFLDKPERRKRHVDIDYKGFEVPDEFVVGYGLDYAEKYRNLPDICILKPEVYSK